MTVVARPVQAKISPRDAKPNSSNFLRLSYESHWLAEGLSTSCQVIPQFALWKSTLNMKMSLLYSS
ncbi:hypothetical protein HOLleu_28398 [Holothuria leucospilota]|uniref:Uncharacterized protein n=1 Tax=Holothuria leucospilota TaxID=206669 RepID=A0A9Q1H1F3_HOLLE|nr:hypothetical protein HOLleu_28398 [Holothuria leucospilota]